MTNSKNTLHLLLAFIVILVSGCQTTRNTLNLDTKVSLQLNALNNINPDADQRPSPVVIRAFQLADVRQFMREDFLNLYENAGERLGRDLLGTVILKEVAPSEQRLEVIDLSEDVTHIGLLAEFIRYEDANAIVVLPITPHKNNKYTITIDTDQIYTGQKPKRKLSASESYEQAQKANNKFNDFKETKESF